MRFLHCADLHLSRAEMDYSFGVLKEIIADASREKCGALLIAGDLFDTRADAEALRGEFRKELGMLPGSCRVFFLPGNHDVYGGPGRKNSLDGLDFGSAEVLDTVPFSREEISGEVELLALPFRRDYSDYRDWKVPEKSKSLRIVVAHGTVPGIVYTGPGEDSPEGIIDPDLFSFHGADYAALGHIHGASLTRLGETLVAYPGSARVWREGETGVRKVYLGTTEGGSLRVDEIPLESAGVYRVVSVEVGLDGGIRLHGGGIRLHEGGIRLHEGGADHGERDWIKIEVSGLVEDERPVIESLSNLKTDLERTCRRVTLDTGGLDVLSGVSTHPLALRFVECWEEGASREERGEEDAEAYRIARLAGLRVLKGLMENRR